MGVGVFILPLSGFAVIPHPYPPHLKGILLQAQLMPHTHQHTNTSIHCTVHKFNRTLLGCEVITYGALCKVRHAQCKPVAFISAGGIGKGGIPNTGCIDHAKP